MDLVSLNAYLKPQMKLLLLLLLLLSYTVQIPIFWLTDLYHVILGCDETTTLTSLSWCNSYGVPCKFNTPLSLHHGFSWLKVYSVFNLNKKNVNTLIAHEFLRFTCTRSLTMKSKFLIPHSAASCGIEISCSLLANSCS